MYIKTPNGWRKGQTIINFLIWLKNDKHVEVGPMKTIADIFYTDDARLDAWWEEYIDNLIAIYGECEGE